MSSETRRRNTNSSEADDVAALIGEQEEEVTSDDEVDESAAMNLDVDGETVHKKPTNRHKCPQKYALLLPSMSPHVLTT